MILNSYLITLIYGYDRLNSMRCLIVLGPKCDFIKNLHLRNAKDIL
jgi:hypothetical protein